MKVITCFETDRGMLCRTKTDAIRGDFKDGIRHAWESLPAKFTSSMNTFGWNDFAEVLLQYSSARDRLIEAIQNYDAAMERLVQEDQ